MGASDPTVVPDGVPADRIDELYGLPLDEFTRARDALAKDLRQHGRRADADWVKGLRKPTAPAWVVNQLARTQSREAAGLVKAGERLRKAHERLLKGRAAASELRAAAAAEDEAVRALASRAPGLLDRRGRSPTGATLERVEETLRAVALDDEARDAFALARVTRELRAIGLGAASPAEAPAASRRRQAAASAGTERQQRPSSRARQAAKAAKERWRERRRAAAAAERDVERARRAADRAQRRLRQATTALERARAAEAEAGAGLREAEAGLRQAR